MQSPPPDLARRLREHGQEHVFAWWDELSGPERELLVGQLATLDLDLLAELFAARGKRFDVPAAHRIAPITVTRGSDISPEVRRQGEDALRRGEVAVLVVAGGQGSRLGFHHPKGMFPVGPVSKKSLFQIHSEKVLALGRRFGVTIPFLIMTSPATDAETRAFFETNKHFGLDRGNVWFFEQGTMPALDLATGKLLMETRGRLFTSPNGHGGALLALAESGLLDRLRDRGIRHVFYYQVDNPLVKVADPPFLGYHVNARAEASTKIVPKDGPDDKLGNLVSIDGRCTIVEYSDLPKEMAVERNPDGSLRYWVGSPAIHVFDVAFLDAVSWGAGRIPFHAARKKVPYIDRAGNEIFPDKENALKLEMFIFDVLPRADRWTVVETSRREELEPLKNASGRDSPASARRAQINLFGEWLETAGIEVPRQNGNVTVPIEISPLFAMDAEELAGKIKPGLKVSGPLYLE